MDWWPTFARLAGLEPPAREWKDNESQPIIFDGIDQSDSLLSKGPGKRENFIYFNDQSFGGVRVKNFKALWTAKDTWLGPELFMKTPAVYDLLWDPGEQYDILFNGAAPTRGDLKSSPGPLFRRGQRLDRFVCRRRGISVLRGAKEIPERSLQALWAWFHRNDSTPVQIVAYCQLSVVGKETSRRYSSPAYWIFGCTLKFRRYHCFIIWFKVLSKYSADKRGASWSRGGEGITTLNKVFAVSAAVFTLFFLWQLIMTLWGMDSLGAHHWGDMSAHSGTDAPDHYGDHGVGGEAFTLISIRSILAFATLFSWAGTLYLFHRDPCSNDNSL